MLSPDVLGQVEETYNFPLHWCTSVQ